MTPIDRAPQENPRHPVTGTHQSNRGGAARLAYLTGALLSGESEALREATGDPFAYSFYPNQVAAILCDDRFQAMEKSRQIGQSWAFAADSLARAILEPATTNIHISTDKWESESKHDYVLRTLDAFPRAYRSLVRTPENSKKHIVIETNHGSASIDFLAQRPPRGAERGGIYLHEMAHMAQMPAILKAGIFCTTRGGFIKGCSSHEGSDSLFNAIIRDRADEETGEQPYHFWTCGSFPWWTCPALCVDIEAAMREAPSLETDERVAKFGTQTLRELRAGSSLDDFREECECQVIDSKYSYFPLELIQKCQVDPESLSFEKLELSARDAGAVSDACALIDRLAQKIRSGLLPGRWYWAMDIGVTQDPDAICIGQTLSVDPNVVALRAVITMEGMAFPQKERIVAHLLRELPIERGFIDATGPGTQMGQWGQREFGQKALPFKFTLQSKSEIVNALKIRMERTDALGARCVMIPVWGKLQRQIHSIRKTVTAGGNAVYDSNRDDKAHADVFWALALMNALVGVPSENYAFVPPVLTRPALELPRGTSRIGQGGFGTGRIWVPGRG